LDSSIWESIDVTRLKELDYYFQPGFFTFKRAIQNVFR